MSNGADACDVLEVAGWSSGNIGALLKSHAMPQPCLPLFSGGGLEPDCGAKRTAAILGCRCVDCRSRSAGSLSAGLLGPSVEEDFLAFVSEALAKVPIFVGSRFCYGPKMCDADEENGAKAVARNLSQMPGCQSTPIKIHVLRLGHTSGTRDCVGNRVRSGLWNMCH